MFKSFKKVPDNNEEKKEETNPEPESVLKAET
jgi:hypothetical protein